MNWLFLGLGVWIAIAIPVALVIGRAVRVADARSRAEAGGRTSPEGVAATDTALPDAPPSSPSDSSPADSSPPSRRRFPVVRAPVSHRERHPSHRDSGVL